jgi:hypothetical protein
MHTITLYTRFDITYTGIRQHHSKLIPTTDRSGYEISTLLQFNVSRSQQSNWETINQLISLRTLPDNIKDPVVDTVDGKKVWRFSFDVSNLDAIGSEDTPLSMLIGDCKGTPFITGLTEETSDITISDKNTWFKISN